MPPPALSWSRQLPPKAVIGTILGRRGATTEEAHESVRGPRPHGHAPPIQVGQRTGDEEGRKPRSRVATKPILRRVECGLGRRCHSARLESTHEGNQLSETTVRSVVNVRAGCSAQPAEAAGRKKGGRGAAGPRLPPLQAARGNGPPWDDANRGRVAASPRLRGPWRHGNSAR